MKKCLGLVISLILVSTSVIAGVSTLLHESGDGDCNIKISHDAVPGEKGVLIIRGRKQSGDSCDISREQARKVFYEGIKKIHHK